MEKYKYYIIMILTIFIVQTNSVNRAEMANAAVLLEKDKNIKIEEKNFTDVSKFHEDIDTEWNELYFRPSPYKSINNKNFSLDFFDQYKDKKASEINLPNNLFLGPKDTIINYFSVLREADTISGGKVAGCGTTGYGRVPYPIAYNFFTDSYKNKVDFQKYFNQFVGISHINLIKIEFIGAENIGTLSEALKYFIEIETLEPTEKQKVNFGYYYGYMYINNDHNIYKISDIELTGEDFLCAPYHGWSHNAEYYVKTVYGNWFKLIDKMYPTKQEKYLKNIRISGTDGKKYLFKFVQLTNGVDVQIGQYVKVGIGKWKLIKINIPPTT